MSKIRIFPSATESPIEIQFPLTALPDSIKFIDTDSFESLINTILSKYQELYLTVTEIDKPGSQIAIKGMVKNYCQVVSLFAGNIEGFSLEPCQINIGFNLVIHGSAVLKTHITDNTLYFDNIIEDNSSTIGG